MRRRKADLRRRVNSDLEIEFAGTGLTSYAGLELLIRYLRRIEFNTLIRRHFSGSDLGGDFGVVAMTRLLVGMLIVGARRLEHVAFVAGDPLVHRFSGLDHLPSARTLSRWLKKFTTKVIGRLVALNAEIVSRVLASMSLRTLTIDVDGTVISTGLKVERAFRGFNPHHRKVPSYFPITAHVGETGHILRVKNRSGNIHDGKASMTFLHDLFAQVRETLGTSYRLNFRFDGAFFRDDIIGLLTRRQAGFAIKVPFWRWIDLQSLIRKRRRWRRIDGMVSAFEKRLLLKPWGITLRVVIYRKKVHHRTRKNFQLDLFDPADGTYEYSAIATNLTYNRRRLWAFMGGRGAHEKTLGELKNGFAFDTVPTNHYGANSAWQQIAVLAHNLLTNFQIQTDAPRHKRSHKATAIHLLKRVQTLRFELFNRAGQIARPAGKTILRLAKNPSTERLLLRTAEAVSRIG